MPSFDCFGDFFTLVLLLSEDLLSLKLILLKGVPSDLNAGIFNLINFSIARRYLSSELEQNEIESPEAPARAVRPIQCT